MTNTITPKESDSGGNKRKRSLKENEEKSSQKKTLWSYFHSSKNKEPENLNGTDIESEMSVSEGQTSGEKSSEDRELENNMETENEKTEPERNSSEISQSAFQLKSLISSRPENLNETEIKSKTSSETQISPSTSAVKASETGDLQVSVKSADEMKEPQNTKQESFQMASSSAINDVGCENLNGTGVKPEIFISESQTSASTSQEKTENEMFQNILKSRDDNKEQGDTNQESLQMDSAVNRSENLNKIEAKPGTSSQSQTSASTPREKASENEDNQGSVESIDEVKEPEKTSQKSYQMAFELTPYVNWRSSDDSITCLLEKAREEEFFTDIQFVMGEGDRRREFHAHKCILACASPVFEEMFFGSLSEERSIIETDDDPDDFEMLLDYIYGTSCSISDTDLPLTSICRFSMIGNKYLVPKVESTIKNFIFFHLITESDFWDVFDVSNFDSLWPLFCDKLESYIMENANDLVSSEKFLNVPEIIVSRVLQMDKLNIEEYELLKGVTKWVYHNKNPVTPKILMEYYKHIRFSRISSYKLMQFIDSYPKALDAETCLQVLKHTDNPSVHDLPKWCSSNKKSRSKALKHSKRGRRCSCSDCNDSDDDAVCRIQ